MIDLLTSWLKELKNADHVGVTSQIYDAVKKTELSNDIYKAGISTLGKAIEAEDVAYKKTQKDWAVEQLKAVDKDLDSYMVSIRAIVAGHTLLPDGEELKQPAKEILQLWKDFYFDTHDSYSGESMKVINMYQELEPLQSQAEKIGVWGYFGKAKQKAEEMQGLLTERFTDLSTRTAGELRNARQATDAAIKQLYQVITSMQVLMSTAELTELAKMLRAIEDYARVYYLKKPASSGDNTTGDGTGSGGSGDTGGGAPSGPGEDSGTPPMGGD